MKNLSAKATRKLFLDFFERKQHHIARAVPIVVQNDPTLFFINAGMNPFKDYFVGNQVSPYKRIANTQKCLRVSGKHNDIEEVGKDHYHHTMFEMLGNWSFGDYFKKESIAWAWEFMTEVCHIPKDRLYVTVFEGSQEDGIEKDDESRNIWKSFLDERRIIAGNKKDNFWEMGDTGPCGPCSEIHIDTRGDEERKKVDGATLVNKDHPEVIEIWNIVFIQYERKQDGKLYALPNKYIDTGMGLERLARVLAGKKSNYETDLFIPLLERTEQITQRKYTASDSQKDIAFRVLADHIRAIAFTIADGQIPSNVGAGYVIRRILRRAVRYYYNFLDYKEPLLYQLVKTLTQEMVEVFPELHQIEYIEKIIKQEEETFLHTLANGLKRVQVAIDQASDTKTIKGQVLFELYDTYGFPVDLTLLIAKENGYTIDEKGFEEELDKQKNRSRMATQYQSGDWIEFVEEPSLFVGYDTYSTSTKMVKYRKVVRSGKTTFQIVCVKTPFYAESGGQAGDTGQFIHPSGEVIPVLDTIKENDTVLHCTDIEPAADRWKGIEIVASVDTQKRLQHAQHHSATHLLHAAMHEVVGKQLTQKGCQLNEEKIRFDFAHPQALTVEEIEKIEKVVNEKIRQNIPVQIFSLPKEEAIQRGAMALFSEKYGDVVRTVVMDERFSIELCGGTHVKSTGEIGCFKIVAQSAVASGVRRVEALAGQAMIDWLQQQTKEWNQAKITAKTNGSIHLFIEQQQKQIKSLQKNVEDMESRLLSYQSEEILQSRVVSSTGFTYCLADSGTSIPSAKYLKDLASQMVLQIDICLLIGRVDKHTHFVLCQKKGAHVTATDISLDKIFTQIILSRSGVSGGGKGNMFVAVSEQQIDIPALLKEVEQQLK